MNNISETLADDILACFNLLGIVEGVSWDNNFNFSLEGTEDIFHFGKMFLTKRIYQNETKIYLRCSESVTYNKPTGQGKGRIKGAPANFTNLFAHVNKNDLFSDILGQIGYPDMLTKNKKYLFIGDTNDLDLAVKMIFNVAIIKLSYGYILKNNSSLTEKILPLKNRTSQVFEEDKLGLTEENLTALRTHKRYERNQKLANQAKIIHGYSCQACGFDFTSKYGELGTEFIEAHHLKPFSSLKGRKVSLDPKIDFGVLCSNCHRMIHKTELTSNIKEFADQYIIKVTNKN